jgi:predicted Fe-Mo cluster-binding NifX family protein
MKTAFAIWEDRIAPVFDTTRQLRLVESDGTAVTGESLESLAPDEPHRIAGRLAELGVGILVCGAISRPLHQLIAAQGIEVVPFVTGETGAVVRAWLGNALDGDSFAMPGCCGRGRRGMLRGQRWENQDMMLGNAGGGKGQGGGGQGGGRGRGQGTGGGMGGGGCGQGGECVCPACGHRLPHERGVPCVTRQCPKCGAAMTRA